MFDPLKIIRNFDPTGLSDIAIGVVKLTALIGGGGVVGGAIKNHDDGNQHDALGQNNINEQSIEQPYEHLENHADLGAISDHSDLGHQLMDWIHHIIP
ncbi:MAG TPA: hypothetical protein DEG17_25360 [Cyanobacteria bacterium UBA11149]|nr:hypothetical protein [Cyanobacteria bacterium UBA11367]HBE58812.1 hypothetical protein [Cyanobacteria bacterium UBA11366]HBK64400.1 hypothetical protein [Cyanobacteria bacterium UBA11166]HBR73410.1 hypothetical protein [Cyanobacteria bacterium UBA11159]HBS68122.1 hypothetical protein [Cyanobacteria bacterium UBA11153]HBW92105.1 hypothetical protein [Cyanobacteria bacterium UBA11149]HCA97350.1 hypothetical protein [Cyanobacteria bacterium UBA9226]